MHSPEHSVQHTVMENEHNHESWAKSSDVTELLAYMLAFPKANHSTKVAEVLPDGLRQAHAAGLTRVLNSIDFKKQPRWKGSATKNKAVAYHIWLYHFLGGDDMKLVPPPLATTADDPLKVQSETWRTQAFRLEIEFKAEVKRLESAIKRGIAGAESDLDALRSARVPHTLLRLQVEEPGAKQAAAGGGGGGGGGGGATEWEQQKASMYAFLMGTHERSVGYASRDEPCAVRLMAHSGDLLQLIGSLVRGTARPELTDEATFTAEADRLRMAVKRGTDGAQSELDALRSARVPHAVLRLRNERPAGIHRPAAAPPAPSPPKPRGRPTPGVWQLAGQVEEHPSRSDPDYQPPRWLTAQMAGRKRLRCLSPPAPQRLPLHGPDGLPLYEGMRAAYERASGPEQRECVPWAAMVQRMGWPATWADRSPMRAGGSA